MDKRIKAAFEQKVMEKVALKSLANIDSFENACVLRPSEQQLAKWKLS